MSDSKKRRPLIVKSGLEAGCEVCGMSFNHGLRIKSKVKAGCDYCGMSFNHGLRLRGH